MIRVKYQRGSGDSGAIILLFVVCTVVSVLLMAITWMGNARKKRAENDLYNLSKRNAKEINVERDLLGYKVTYKRGLFGFKEQ